MPIGSKNAQGSASVADDSLVKKSVAARRLGISVRTVDRLVEKGLLERVFVGTARRFRVSEIERIIEGRS